MIIATVWVEDWPLGVELEEDEEPFLDTKFDLWIETGNYAFCNGVDALEDYVISTEKDLSFMTDSYWEHARKAWMKQ